MSSLTLLARPGPLFGRPVLDHPEEAMPRERDPCGGEHVIDFALCLVIAAATVGLMLLAL
ncbi:hypothetical protein [Methylobacterium brachythecii]|uniref:Uncharacterized protein n=1 Tax=Methylobacterium brachythecii TaxID=1176177 RepID=A0A7W6AKZ8_9HYPH|nr:hypothetical protein [Methylobacterium brachythecii]MBB3901682.1 hypothetical protein [Methylobacterium brachythecii]GLS43960.1 hypothetical protein GCM10007884_19460 [Methylobacterium brachythecii]